MLVELVVSVLAKLLVPVLVSVLELVPVELVVVMVVRVVWGSRGWGFYFDFLGFVPV